MANPGFEGLPGTQLGADVHRDHHVGPMALATSTGMLLTVPPSARDAAVPLHRLEGTGNGHGGLHCLGEAAVIQHEGVTVSMSVATAR